jgi:DegV family protein with EDD domain
MIKLLTDSACDLSNEMITELDIHVLPLIVFDENSNEYLDGATISSKQVFDAMREGKVYKTSQVPPEAFLGFFRTLAEDDEVLYIAFSSGLSGTYNSALQAREVYLEEGGKARIEILDTLAASGGFGLIVHHTALKLREGADLNELVDYTKTLIERIDQLFTVDDLEYLFRGGRVSRSSALIGGLLNIKPVLTILEGKLVPLEKTRGRLKSIKRMCELLGERTEGRLDGEMVFITHGDDLEAANKLKDLIKEAYGERKFVISPVGSTIGAHSGPGTLAVFYLKPIQ